MTYIIILIVYLILVSWAGWVANKPKRFTGEIMLLSINDVTIVDHKSISFAELEKCVHVEISNAVNIPKEFFDNNNLPSLSR